jgi:hypothetical protein
LKGVHNAGYFACSADSRPCAPDRDVGGAAFEGFVWIARTEFLPHDETTSLRSLTRELDWNAVGHCFAHGIKPARPRSAFQVSGRSLSEALKRSMTTYREVNMAAIRVRGCQDR